MNAVALSTPTATEPSRMKRPRPIAHRPETRPWSRLGGRRCTACDPNQAGTAAVFHLSTAFLTVVEVTVDELRHICPGPYDSAREACRRLARHRGGTHRRRRARRARS